MKDVVTSDGLKLEAHVARPHPGPDASVPGVVIVHGLPTGSGAAQVAALTYPELAERLANDRGWAAMAFHLRGCGDSEGSFSLGGWRRDVAAAVDHFTETVPVAALLLVGFGAGGSLAICHAADDQRVLGVAALSARADFDDWVAQPRRFLEHVRQLGMVRDVGYPPSFDRWARELRTVNPMRSARRLAPRPLLLVHGDDDDVHPLSDARSLAEAHGSATLSVIGGAGSRLRHDPRSVAILLGWLDRQWNDVAGAAMA